MSIRVHFIDDERKALYGAIFPDGVPVTSPVPSLCNLDGAGRQPCHILDFQAISLTQYNALVEAIAQRFGAVRVAVASQISQQGLPIRADQTTLVVDGPQLGLLMPDAVGHFDDLHQLEEVFGSDDDDFYDWDDDGDDPNRCPRCGDMLDAEGYCSDMECGYSLAWEDDDADPIELMLERMDMDDDAPPADNVNEIPF